MLFVLESSSEFQELPASNPHSQLFSLTNSSEIARMDVDREHASETRESAQAALYVRMSTEHQQYSTENQMDAIRRYAESRKMQIVRTYSDEARSGLNIEGRHGLRDLIAEVENGRADYTEILVYDVSRWGRFQDVDE